MKKTPLKQSYMPACYKSLTYHSCPSFMVTDKLKTLAQAKAKVAELEKSITAELNQELAALPGKFGFDDVAAFVDAVRSASRSSGSKGKPRGRRPAAAAAAPASTGGKRRKRAIITSETRSKVKSLVEAGKTGAEIARSVGISLPSVQNIKKDLGLVKSRK
jgi:DNA-binding NarL/FixJ family response regulator